MFRSLLRRWVSTRQGFKPRHVEEPIDYYWHRPLAAVLVRLLERSGISPNQVTLLSGLFSLLSGAALTLGCWYGSAWAAIGGCLLLVGIVLDCADGQLARVLGISSPVGRALDGLMDSAAPLFVFHGIAFFLLSKGFAHAYVWPLGWGAALSLIWHASTYDVTKNVFLHCSRPDFSLGGATLLTVADMANFRRDLQQQGDRSGAFIVAMWIVWTTPQMKTLEPWIGPARTPQNEAERQLFLQHYLKPMTTMTWLGFGTHLFLVTLACWLAPWEPRSLWVAWFIMLGPMNLACLWVVGTQQARERRYLDDLQQLRLAEPNELS